MNDLAEFLLARIDATFWAWAEYQPHDERRRAFVLADCDAKRRIIELHQRHESTAHFERWNHAERRMERWRGAACAECGHIDECPVQWPCLTLHLLALPYADHPDYRDEWAPDTPGREFPDSGG